MAKQPKVAIVADWITSRGGAERVVYALHQAFPDAPIYTSVYQPSPLMKEFEGLDIRTTWIQKLPRFLRKFHKLFPVIRVWAFRSLDLSQYDVVISSSSAESKQVRVRKDAIHICYCHTPIRYYWSHYHEYKDNPPFGKLNLIIKPIIPLFVRWMRRYDYQAAQKVDYFIANSNSVRKRIKQYYNRDANVIYPPVSTERFTSLPEPKTRAYFMAFSRQEPYKRIDLAVAACTKLNLPLRVYGTGSQHEKLFKMAGPTVEFIENVNDEEVAQAFKSAKAYIFPAEEDFGIVQVEALAAGTPVIAYGRGGALEIVENGTTGITFEEQTSDSLIEALKKFHTYRFDSTELADSAARFNESIFTTKIKEFAYSKGEWR